MQLLQRLNAIFRLLRARSQRLYQGMGPGHRGHAGHVMLQRGAAYCLLVEMRSAAQRRVDDQSDFALLDVIRDVWPAFVDLENAGDWQTDLLQPRRGSNGGHQI